MGISLDNIMNHIGGIGDGVEIGEPGALPVTKWWQWWLKGLKCGRTMFSLVLSLQYESDKSSKTDDTAKDELSIIRGCNHVITYGS